MGNRLNIWGSARVMRILARAAAALLACSALPLVGDRTGSAIGSLLGHFVAGRATRCVFPRAQLNLVLDGGTITSVEYSDPRFAHAATSCVVAVYRGWARPSGVWAPTHESRRHWVRVDPIGGSPTPAQLAAARAYAVSTLDAAESGFTSRELAALATADVFQSRTLWWGYAHNALSLLLLVASIIGWTRAAYVAGMDRRADARIAAGLCPRCRYSRAGLDPGAPCPECGATSAPGA